MLKDKLVGDRSSVGCESPWFKYVVVTGLRQGENCSARLFRSSKISKKSCWCIQEERIDNAWKAYSFMLRLCFSLPASYIS